MPDDRRDLDSLFLSALEIASPDERSAFISSACGEDLTLRQELERMLASHKLAGSFLEHPAVELDATHLLEASDDDRTASLDAGLATAFDGDAAVILGNSNHSVLRSLGRSLNHVPRVCLRESETEAVDLVTQPSSLEIPKRQADSRYQLHGEIARGGMGAIIKGRDSDLGRDLAIKVLLDSHKDNPNVIQRFVEEAQIGGQLQHPGIAPIYELGQFNDHRPFFAMKLVKGQTLAKLLSEREEAADDRGKFIGIFEQVCQTMAYAHSRGVIHRDLKPANIMVGAFGEVQVMDWGLAKILQVGGVADEKKSRMQQGQSIVQTSRSGAGSDDPAVVSVGSASAHTQMGSVMGTPAYMPPEQALGEVDQIDERADVFGLGAILCEILTGQPPYVAHDGAGVFRMASRGKLGDAFERLGTCGADKDLIALTKHCLELQPVDRPRDAGVVAEWVTCYLESVEEKLREAEVQRAAESARADAEEAQATAERQRAEAQAARAEAESARASEESKRRRTSLAMAASVLLLVGLGSMGWLYFSLAAGRKVKLNQYLWDIKTAQLAIDDGNLEAAENLLLTHRDSPNRGWEWDYLRSSARGDAHEELGKYAKSSLTFMNGISPDDKHILLMTTGSKNLVLWNLITRAVDWTKVSTLAQKGWTSAYEQGRVAIGGEAAAGSENQSPVQVWDPLEEELIWESPERFQHVTVALSKSQPWLAYYAESGLLKVVDYETNEILLEKNDVRWPTDMRDLHFEIINKYGGPARMLAFSPDGKRLVSGIARNSFVEVWDIQSGQRILEPTRVHENSDLEHRGTFSEATACSFSPDGEQLLVCFNFGTPLVLDLQTREKRRPFGENASGSWEIFLSPDRNHYVSCGSDSDVHIWSTEDFQLERTLRGHRGEAGSACFTHNGRAVISVDLYGNIFRWDLNATSVSPMVSKDETIDYGSRMLLTDNETIAFATRRDGRVVRIDLEDGGVSETDFHGTLLGLSEKTAELLTLAPVSPGTDEPRRLHRWDLNTNKHRTLKFPVDAIEAEYFSAHDEVMWRDKEGNYRLISLGPNASTPALPQVHASGSLIPSLAGGQIVASRFQNDSSQVELKLYERGTEGYKLARKVFVDTGGRKGMEISVSPDGRWLAFATREHHFYLVDLAEPKTELQRLGATKRGTRNPIFSPDSRTVLICADDGTIRAWHLPTQRELLTIQPGSYSSRLMFHRSGKWLLAVGGTEDPNIPDVLTWWSIKD